MQRELIAGKILSGQHSKINVFWDLSLGFVTSDHCLSQVVITQMSNPLPSISSYIPDLTEKGEQDINDHKLRLSSSVNQRILKRTISHLFLIDLYHTFDLRFKIYRWVGIRLSVLSSLSKLFESDINASIWSFAIRFTIKLSSAS